MFQALFNSCIIVIIVIVGRYETECVALVREGDDTPGKLVGEALVRVLVKKGLYV